MSKLTEDVRALLAKRAPCLICDDQEADCDYPSWVSRYYVAALCSEVERLERLIEPAYREGWEDAEDYALAGPNMRGSVHARVDAAWLASTARQQIGQD